jgi:hypothetical protein
VNDRELRRIGERALLLLAELFLACSPPNRCRNSRVNNRERFRFREENEPEVTPGVGCVGHLGFDPIHDRADPRIGRTLLIANIRSTCAIAASRSRVRLWPEQVQTR